MWHIKKRKLKIIKNMFLMVMLIYCWLSFILINYVFLKVDHCWRAKALTSESNKKINYDNERKSTEGKDYFKAVL